MGSPCLSFDTSGPYQPAPPSAAPGDIFPAATTAALQTHHHNLNKRVFDDDFADAGHDLPSEPNQELPEPTQNRDHLFAPEPQHVHTQEREPAEQPPAKKKKKRLNRSKKTSKAEEKEEEEESGILRGHHEKLTFYWLFLNQRFATGR